MSDVLQRKLSVEFISSKAQDSDYILNVINHSFVLITKLNKLNYNNPRVREILKELFNKEFDNTNVLIPRNITIGKGYII